MAKQSLNINDFSGGFNSLVDKRDLEENESSLLVDVVSYNKGSLKLAGAFSPAPAFTQAQVGYNDPSFQGVTNSWYIQPSQGFIKFQVGTIVASGTDATVTSNNHGLSSNTLITIMNASSESNLEGLQFRIHTILDDSFHITITSDTINEALTYAIGADFVQSEWTDSIELNEISPYSDSERNQYILKNTADGKFGFFNVNLGYWFGSPEEEVNSTTGSNNYLFDTTYLWTGPQYGANHPEVYTQPSDASFSPIITAGFYIDGVFRVQETHPKYWQFGWVKRPVGYYYIKGHKKFGDEYRGDKYMGGWYNLPSHILSSTEYRTKNFQYDHSGFNTAAGIIIGSSSAEGNIADPTEPYMVNVGVSTTGEGDWQSGSGSDNVKIGLGVSLIYDDIETLKADSFSQESNVCRLTTDGTSGGTNEVAISGGGDGDSLKLGIKMYSGSSTATNSMSGLFSTNYSNPWSHSSQNFDANQLNTNPRIVGINIYMTSDNIETFTDPLLLATVGIDKKDPIISHDGTSSNVGWTGEENVKYVSITIKSIPIIRYNESKNGYDWNENINAWYTTSAIVNRRLYAGNVSYFENKDFTSDSNHLDFDRLEKISNYPDRILVSPINKFDTLPSSSALELSKADGQDIIKLEAFHSLLLVFKTNDIYVIDLSTGLPVLKNTLYGMGVKNKHQILSTDKFVYFFNKTGIYAFDGEQSVNIINKKMLLENYRNKYYNSFGRLYHSNQSNFLILTTNYSSISDAPDNFDIESDPTFVNKALMIDLDSGGLYHKENLSTFNFKRISNQILIGNEIYCTGTHGISDETFSIQQTTDAFAGTKASTAVMIRINSGGTCAATGTTALVGQLSNDVRYMKVRDGSVWRNVLKVNGATGAEPLSDVDYETLSGATSILIEHTNLNTLADHLRTRYSYDNTDSNYYINQVYVVGYYDDPKLFIQVKAKLAGTAYNLSEIDLTSVDSDYGSQCSIAFANNNTESSSIVSSGIAIGNIDTYEKAEDYTNETADAIVVPVWKLSLDRNENITKQTKYSIIASDGMSLYQTFEVEAGIDYFIHDDAYTTLQVDTADNDVNNDNLTSNIRAAIIYGKIKSNETNDTFDPGWTLDFLGSTGSKYLQFSMLPVYAESLTENYGLLVNFSVNVDVQIPKNSTVLLKWQDSLPKNGSTSLLTSSNIIVETKDIDFNEPGVRKKIYKAYITYTGGNGNIACQYNANQSSSWTNATVLDGNGAAATNAGYLNTSSTQTRAELTFGTGGNNIYSFALKFLALAPVDNFEINDLTLIYRLKKPK